MASADENNSLEDLQAPDTEVRIQIPGKKAPKKPRPSPELVTWIMGKVNRWRENRDSVHGDKWSEYSRIFKGKWDPSLIIKEAERSRFISPVTQSAIDQTVSEMADAVFGRGEWFDLTEEDSEAAAAFQKTQQIAALQAQQSGQPPPPPLPDPLTTEETVRGHLLDDLQNAGFKADALDIFHNGALYGTGIAKRHMWLDEQGNKMLSWVPISAPHFVIDTAALKIRDALGCAHETVLPKHEIQKKQLDGEYYKDDDLDTSVSSMVAQQSRGTDQVDILAQNSDLISSRVDAQDGVKITEYHGLVPRSYLPGGKGEKGDAEGGDLFEGLYADGEEPHGASSDDDLLDLVEAVVIIANGSSILSAEANELEDRGVAAYQHYLNPDSFWGLGVAEKAYNSQKGLDGEVRARQDALSITSYPMLGIDNTRMPRMPNMRVSPGKLFLTNGPPNEIIQPINFGGMNNASFQQSGDMERYVQVATGATDPAKPINGNSTATGQSQQSSAFIKRAKLTMQSVDGFLATIVRKSLVALSAMSPDRYPKLPFFVVNSAMSVMAREFEQSQMTNLLAIVPQTSPMYAAILKGLIQNYGGPNKAEILQSIDAANKPDPAQAAAAQRQQQIAEQKAMKDLELLQAQIDKTKSETGLTTSKSKHEDVQTQLAPVNTRIQAEQAITSRKQAHTNASQVSNDAAKAQIDHHHRTQDHQHRRIENYIAYRKGQQVSPA